MSKFLATASVLALVAAVPALAANPASAPNGSVAYHRVNTTSNDQQSGNGTAAPQANQAANATGTSQPMANEPAANGNSMNSAAGSSKGSANTAAAQPAVPATGTGTGAMNNAANNANATGNSAANQGTATSGTGTAAANKPGANKPGANNANAMSNGAAGTAATAPMQSSATSGAAGAETATTQPMKQPVSQKDRTFVKQAMSAGMAEVEEGHMAMTRASDLAVQEFGRWMVTDHDQLNLMLTRRAKLAGITPMPTLAPHDQQTVTRLKSLNGAGFEKQYVVSQVAAHEQAVKLFDQEAKDGRNPGLRSLADVGAVMLKQHLAEAQQLQSALPEIVAASNKR